MKNRNYEINKNWCLRIHREPTSAELEKLWQGRMVILKLTPEERQIKREECINKYIPIINNANNETTKCGFITCDEGKTDLRGKKDSCMYRYREPTPEELETLKNEKP